MNKPTWLLCALFVIAVGVALTVTVGSRLSSEALAVLTGALCGVGAVLPATILGVVALIRATPSKRSQGESRMYPPRGSDSPLHLPPGIPVYIPRSKANARARVEWRQS